MDEKQIAKPFETELPYKLMAEEHFWRMRSNGWMAKENYSLVTQRQNWVSRGQPCIGNHYYSYGCFYNFYHNINYLHFPKYQKPRELLLLSNESLLLTLQNCYLLIRAFRNTQWWIWGQADWSITASVSFGTTSKQNAPTAVVGASQPGC